MPMARAMKLCPKLIIVSGRHGEYGKISKQVMDYLGTLTPLIEQVSIDEAFLDLSDIPESGDSLAKTIGVKVPHYGKYSYLVFEGSRNRVKGTWDAASSPLTLRWPK